MKNRSKSVHSSEQLFAQALVDAVGQLDEELSFKAGDIITVTEVIDEDWYKGECHGKSGIFLAACVQLLNEEECNASPALESSHSSVQSKKDKESNRISDEYSSHYNNYKSTGQLNIQGHDACSNQYQAKPVEHADRGMSYTSENTKTHCDTEDGVTPYARTLYPFVGELTDELSFEANDIVTLIQHVDEQWIEGEIDGKIGLFPANYVEIVVDCPYAYKTDDIGLDIVESDVVAAGSKTNHIETDDYEKVDSVAKTVNTEMEKPVEISKGDESVEEHYGLVLYDFNAETAQDLTVYEGETVTVIKQIDENWLLVRNDDGKTGMCPVVYVDLIGAPPELTSASHDKNFNEIKEESGQTKEKLPDRKHGIHNKDTAANEVHDKPCVVITSSVKDVEPSAIHVPLKADSSIDHSISSRKSPINAKPVLKPKPLIAPKPALKPKPSISSKPWAPAGHKPVTFDPKASIPKSTSSKSLSQYNEGSETDTQTSKMTKAQSMFEINNQSESRSVNETSQLESKESNPGSTSSLTSDTERRSSDANTDSHSKKMFDDWDLTKPLDSLLHSEFSKAKHEAEIKSRSSSLRSSGSSGHSHRSMTDTDTKGVDETDRASTYHKSVVGLTGNYSRENFEEGLSFGNSTFFISDQKRVPHRKPPPPPGRSSVKNDFARKPSLKKPAPPRPAGPRIAPAPSKVPIVPTRTESAKTVPSHSVPAGSAAIPARPQGAPRKHGRPAPPRPQATPSKLPGEDLMGFSPPTNSAICKYFFFLQKIVGLFIKHIAFKIKEIGKKT